VKDEIMDVKHIHENVVNENEWGDLECLQSQPKQILVKAYSQTLAITITITISSHNMK
jgi:hypothetical protein